MFFTIGIEADALTQHSPVCDTVRRSEHHSEGQSTLHEHFEGARHYCLSVWFNL